jgi:hypothetical protein
VQISRSAVGVKTFPPGFSKSRKILFLSPAVSRSFVLEAEAVVRRLSYSASAIASTMLEASVVDIVKS